jgi:hypothetical protein
MIRFAFCLAATLVLFAGRAMANWEFTQWNMTENALQAAAGKVGVTLSPTTDKEKSDHTGPITIDPTGKTPDHPSSVAQWKATMPSYFDSTVYFLLDDSKRLAQLTVVMPADQCVPFGQSMVKAYGNSVSNQDQQQPGGFIFTEWRARRQDDISFMWAHALPGSPDIGATCSADWSR